jgi:amidase
MRAQLEICGRRDLDGSVRCAISHHVRDDHIKCPADPDCPGFVIREPAVLGHSVDDIAHQPAWRLSELVRSGTLSCREVLEAHLERIERFNPALNAIVAMNRTASRERADATDLALAAGATPGILTGVPLTMKDTLDAVGMASTWGLAALRHNRPARNAPILDRLLGAGATFLGKTNVPPNSQGWQTANDLFGVTVNPWDHARSPGGSCGGGAAALAAGLTALDFGADVGGSLRNPAHYCGVYSHRPTHGIVDFECHEYPGGGLVPDLASMGPLARCVRDLDLMLGLMIGPRSDDEDAWTLTLPSCARNVASDFRVAVVLDDPQARVDHAVREALCALVEHLRATGADVTVGAFPDIDPEQSHLTFRALAEAASAGSVSDAEFRRAEQTVLAVDPGDASAAANYLRNLTMSHRTWIEHDLMRGQIRRAWTQFFRGYDVFLCPAAATTAPPHSSERFDHLRTIVVDGKPARATDQYFWAGLGSVAGLPVTTAPLGLAPDGLPVGVQIHGARFADRTCLAFAAALERDYRAFTAPPGYA